MLVQASGHRWERDRSASSGGHVRGIVLQKVQNNPASKAARGAFFAKGAKNASFEERAKGKGKTLGEESPKKLHIPSWVRFGGAILRVV
ncbi:MAG: hypothetical protein H7834_01800 [Magnetococcus sp. YQC-9]